ncbi:MAG: hypothetical protein HY286_05810 [Planctomycetes bacterium]|nr:hypothetical protein [Planctomycetota bacterium]
MTILKFIQRSLVLGVVAACPAVSFAQQDKIFTPGQDKPTQGTIEDESLTEIAIKTGGGAKTSVQLSQNPRVEYGSGNSPFAKAIENMSKGDFPAAQAILEPLKPEREIFVPRRLYLLGRCLEGMGKFKDAEDKYNELVSKYDKNYYTKLSIRSLVDVQIKNKNFAAAVATADKGGQIAQNVKNNGLALEFRFIKGTVLEAQDKLTEAESEYRAVAGAPDGGRYAKLGECGIARIAAKSGDAEKVKAIVDPIIKGKDEVLLAAAYAAMGEALLNRGVKEIQTGGAEKIREAAIENFLRVIVQFPPPSNESQDDLERAYFGYIRACKRISEVEKKKEDVDFWKAQVAVHARDLKERFPSSRYIKLVEELSR